MAKTKTTGRHWEYSEARERLPGPRARRRTSDTFRVRTDSVRVAEAHAKKRGRELEAQAARRAAGLVTGMRISELLNDYETEVSRDSPMVRRQLTATASRSYADTSFNLPAMRE